MAGSRLSLLARIKVNLPGVRKCCVIKYNCFALPAVRIRAHQVGRRVGDSHKNGRRPCLRGLSDPCCQGALAVTGISILIIDPPDAVIGAAVAIQAEINEILDREGTLITKQHKASNARISCQAAVVGPGPLPRESPYQVERKEPGL